MAEIFGFSIPQLPRNGYSGSCILISWNLFNLSPIGKIGSWYEALKTVCAVWLVPNVESFTLSFSLNFKFKICSFFPSDCLSTIKILRQILNSSDIWMFSDFPIKFINCNVGMFLSDNGIKFLEHFRAIPKISEN